MGLASSAGKVRLSQRRKRTKALSVITGLMAVSALGPPGAAGALTYVEGDKVSTSGNVGQGFATCPASTFRVGGGAFSTGGLGDVAITGSFPASAAQWSEFTDVFQNESQQHRAYAICDTAAPALRSTPKNVPAEGDRTIRAECPGDRNVYGGGYSSGGAYEATATRSSRPFDDGDGNRDRDDGWEATFISYFQDPVLASVYALCGPKGSTTVSKTREVAAFTQGFVGRSCPQGDRLTGGGARISGGARFTWISSLYPDDGGDADSVIDDRWGAYLENNDGQTKRRITAYAVCR